MAARVVVTAVVGATATAAWLTLPADDSTWPLPGLLLTTVVLTVVANLRIGGSLCIPVVVVAVLVGLVAVLTLHGRGEEQMGPVVFVTGAYLATIAAVASALTTIVKSLLRTRPAP